MADLTVRLFLDTDGESVLSFNNYDIVSVIPNTVIVTVDETVLDAHMEDNFESSYFREGQLVQDATEMSDKQDIEDWTLELAEINTWIRDTQDIVTQEYLGEILNTDQVFVDYLAERAIKLARKVELEGYLGL